MARFTTPLDHTKLAKLKKGSPIGCTGATPAAGYVDIVITEGDHELCAHPQKKAKKNITSEVIKSNVAVVNVDKTGAVWIPQNVPSRITSPTQHETGHNNISMLATRMNIVPDHTHNTNSIGIPNKNIETVKGHADGSINDQGFLLIGLDFNVNIKQKHNYAQSKKN